MSIFVVMQTSLSSGSLIDGWQEQFPMKQLLTVFFPRKSSTKIEELCKIEKYHTKQTKLGTLSKSVPIK